MAGETITTVQPRVAEWSFREIDERKVRVSWRNSAGYSSFTPLLFRFLIVRSPKQGTFFNASQLLNGRC